MKSKVNILAIISLILASIIWGATGPIMKQTLYEVPIFPLAFIRFSHATLLLLPFVINKLFIKKEDLPLLIVSALLGVTLNISFFFWGLTLTTAINSGIIVASTPIFTVIASYFILKEKIKRNIIIGAILGIAGIGVIIGQDILSHGLSLSPLGDFIILLAVFNFILYEMLSKKLFKTYNPLTITFYSFLIGALTFLPATIFEFERNSSWINNLSQSSLIGILYGIFFSSFAAYSLWQLGLSKMQASRVGFFFYIDPLASTIAALILLSEQITLAFVIGSTFIFLGLLFAETNILYKSFLQHIFSLNPRVKKKVLTVEANNPL